MGLELGFQLAFKIGKDAIELETKATDALREWDDWRWFTDPRHTRLAEQLNQRISVGALTLNKRVIVPNQNMLARYLAEHGATTKLRAVRIYRPFGRISELWHLDMGLGYIGGNFQVVDEDEYEAMQQQEMMVDVRGGVADACVQASESGGSVAGGLAGHGVENMD
ncbi:hypothetical protein DCAR_0519683 [Daucus carota subsp. sativus]|uniref:Uncharacterized protein n=1 Tax=Daucus carota subsp. sativus TaxID=79200 RepID=A0A164Y4P1_DAUCS|nr:hypothetical protein DCAR_0519683 [Daucus carota subsp. sativus]